MPNKQIAIIGGGAAGFFAAIACARANPENQISIYERGSEFLTKVRISGGGRCNVTHAPLDPRTLSEHYPRGERALISPFHRFSPTDTVAWFEARGVRLKTEPDGRMFPVTDSSRTIIDCLLNEAKAAGVRLFARTGIDQVRTMRAEHGFGTNSGSGNGRHPSMEGRALPIHISSRLPPCHRRFPLDRRRADRAISRAHHHPTRAVSLFVARFHAVASCAAGRLDSGCPGIGLRNEAARARAIADHAQWRERTGSSCGSRRGARESCMALITNTLRVDWLPTSTEEAIRAQLQSLRQSNLGRLVTNSPLAPLPARLWEQLALSAGIDRETRWTTLSRVKANALAQVLTHTELRSERQIVTQPGDEFVTCGGVSLREIDSKTMEATHHSEVFISMANSSTR